MPFFLPRIWPPYLCRSQFCFLLAPDLFGAHRFPKATDFRCLWVWFSVVPIHRWFFSWEWFQPASLLRAVPFYLPTPWFWPGDFCFGFLEPWRCFGVIRFPCWDQPGVGVFLLLFPWGGCRGSHFTRLSRRSSAGSLQFWCAWLSVGLRSRVSPCCACFSGRRGRCPSVRFCSWADRWSACTPWFCCPDPSVSAWVASRNLRNSWFHWPVASSANRFSSATRLLSTCATCSCFPAGFPNHLIKWFWRGCRFISRSPSTTAMRSYCPCTLSPAAVVQSALRYFPSPVGLFFQGPSSSPRDFAGFLEAKFGFIPRFSSRSFGSFNSSCRFPASSFRSKCTIFLGPFLAGY